MFLRKICKAAKYFSGDRLVTPSQMKMLETRHKDIKSRVGHGRYKDIKLLFTYNEFVTWHRRNVRQFNRLNKQWEKSGFEKRLRPCIDRINTKGHYDLGNIQWITMEYNSRKDNPNTKLTDNIVRKARKLNKKGWGAGRLACRFGVDPSTMERAIKGKTWKHLN